MNTRRLSIETVDKFLKDRNIDHCKITECRTDGTKQIVYFITLEEKMSECEFLTITIDHSNTDTTLIQPTVFTPKKYVEYVFSNGNKCDYYRLRGKYCGYNDLLDLLAITMNTNFMTAPFLDKFLHNRNTDHCKITECRTDGTKQIVYFITLDRKISSYKFLTVIINYYHNDLTSAAIIQPYNRYPQEYVINMCRHDSEFNYYRLHGKYCEYNDLLDLIMI